MKNVKVNYPDDTFSVRSFESQVESNVDETTEYKAWFYWTLLYLNKPVVSRFATYSLTDRPVTNR